LITGDRHVLDIQESWSHFVFLNTPGYKRSGSLYDFPGGTGATGIVYATQVRATAWGLRTVSDFTAYAPDDHPTKAYFQNLIANNLVFWNYLEGIRRDTDVHEHGYYPANVREKDNKEQMQYANFLAWSMDRMWDQGFVGGEQLFLRLAGGPAMMMTHPDYDREQGAPNVIDYRDPETKIWYTTMAELWEQSLDRPKSWSQRDSVTSFRLALGAFLRRFAE